MKNANLQRMAAIAVALLLISGCKSRQPASAPVSNFTRVDAATAATISGVVHFSGKAPERVDIDMAQDPACTMGSVEKNLSEQYVVNNGGLANVFIYVKSGLVGNFAPPAKPAVLDQKGCRYVPHVVGAMVGQPVEFRNSDPTMHNIHPTPDGTGAAAAGFDISQAPMGDPVQHVFPQAQLMLPIRCNNHPWMNAFVNVVDNPFFAVTGADGRFTIAGLPPGTYTLGAVHEKSGEQTLQITVAPRQSATAEFTFTAPAK